MLWAAALVAAACGPGRPASSASSAEEQPGSPAPAPPAADAGLPRAGGGLPPGCPRSFAAAAGSCDQAVARQYCRYPEGTCYCGQEPHCGGARPSDEEMARRPIVWVCAATPPAVRADGCPGADPEGSACSQPGKTCVYGDCCEWRVECRAGTWTRTGGGCPP